LSFPTDAPHNLLSVRTPEGRQLAALHLIEQGIDCLVVCGGDGSLTGADFLRREWPSMVEVLLADGQISEAQAQAHAHLNIVGLVGSIECACCRRNLLASPVC
jgi:6-phosphofructokinase 1